MKTRNLAAVGALALALAVPAHAGNCGSSASAASWGAQADKPSIVETAVSSDDFTTLTAALKTAGLVEALSGKGPFTVFAPTDEAFAKLPAGTVESLLKPENRDQLVKILQYHVVAGELPAEKVVASTGAKTLAGERVAFQVSDAGVAVDNAMVTQTDIACSNGVIHVIDTVLLPSTETIVGTATSAGQFGTLLAALDAAELRAVLEGEGPFTVFAPTDDAFAKLPAGTVESLLQPENRDKLAAVLKYHVLSGRIFADEAITAERAQTIEGSRVHIQSAGGQVRIDEAVVVAADIDATNGVIHVIDSVLLPN